jgi:adenylate cyclase
MAALMNVRPGGIVAFLREAKRRRVYISVVAYAGVSVIIIELTNAVAEALLFPDWTPRLVTFLLVLGFPAVLVLAWIFDITSKGVVKTPDLPQDESRREMEPAEVRVTPASRDPARPRLGQPRSPMPSLRRRAVPPAVAVEVGAGVGEPPDPERLRRATLGHVRHELRTPINGIIGYAEMLLEDVEEEAFTQDLERILAGGRTLLGLVDQVLGNGVAGGALDRDLESYAEEIRVGLRTPVTSVVGYAEMLLETAREDGRDELIPDLERIRTSAHRLLERSADIVGLATEGEGALGLEGSTASELTRSVLSKVQQGGGEGMALAEGRLLVVDDNAENRDLLSRQLARQGYLVLTASDGAQALELLETQTVDLILLDVIMPGMDGVETLQRLKTNEKFRNIPVLMLSSLDETDGAVRCIELGAEDFLSKPLRPAVLEARIAANLELCRLRDRERHWEERSASDDALIEELLLGAFPRRVAERVRTGDSDLADVAPEATVLTCSVRGISTPSSSRAVSEQLQGLRGLCAAVEALVLEHGVETLIWRPGGFTAVAGAPTPVEDHLDRGAALGQELLVQSAKLRGPGGEPLRIGLGLHTGPVAAAALGGERLRYEVWGEGVKTAEAVAAVALDGTLLASPPVHSRLKEKLSFEAQQVRDVAGVHMRTYRLLNGVG